MSDKRSARPAGKNTGRKTFAQRFWTEVRGYAEALAIAYLVVTFVFNTVGVVGSSMRPNLDGGVGGSNVLRSLLTGDRVFIPKYDTWLRRAGLLGPYRRGEIVVVREPANAPTAQERDRRPFFIKRVIARGGDRLRIDDGRVFVNGVAIDQRYLTESGEITPDPIDFPVISLRDSQLNGLHVRFATTLGGTAVPQLPNDGSYPPPVPASDPRVELYYGEMLDALAPFPENAPEGEPFVHELIVPEGDYWVMGDNRQSSAGGSEDSRYFGTVDGITVAGRATAVIWPPRRDGAWNWRRLVPPPAFEEIPPPEPATNAGTSD
ncbi:MAG: signal peptidase I [Trueperaceae bacterium]|nr:signal peptidase I [Trueperaceae bacterium]